MKRGRKKGDGGDGGFAVHCVYSALVPIEEIKPNPRNPNKHPTKQIEMLAKIIRESGWRAPITVSNRNGLVVHGHGRLEAARLAGCAVCPVEYQDYPNEASEIADMIADNKLAGMSELDEIELGVLLDEITDGGLSVELAGFTANDLGDLTDANAVEDRGGREEPNENLVVALRDDVRFPGAGPWELPIIRDDMILDDRELSLWTGTHEEGKTAFWNYGSDSTKGLDWSRCVVGFYTSDDRFEAMWKDTAGHVAWLRNRHVAGMISPNFSTYYKWPAALRLWNVFRSRWIARYAQEAGIRIIPDISGAPDDLSWLLDGLPCGGVISIQVHRERREDVEKKNAVIEAAIKQLSPAVVWCYGQEEKAEWYPALEGQRCRWITPRTRVMQRRIEEKADA